MNAKYQGNYAAQIAECNGMYEVQYGTSKKNLPTPSLDGERVIQVFDKIDPSAFATLKQVAKRLEKGHKVDLTSILD